MAQIQRLGTDVLPPTLPSAHAVVVGAPGTCVTQGPPVLLMETPTAVAVSTAPAVVPPAFAAPIPVAAPVAVSTAPAMAPPACAPPMYYPNYGPGYGLGAGIGNQPVALPYAGAGTNPAWRVDKPA